MQHRFGVRTRHRIVAENLLHKTFQKVLTLREKRIIIYTKKIYPNGNSEWVKKQYIGLLRRMKNAQ